MGVGRVLMRALAGKDFGRRLRQPATLRPRLRATTS
eukprot:gene9018-biopygen2135